MEDERWWCAFQLVLRGVGFMSMKPLEKSKSMSQSSKRKAELGVGQDLGGTHHDVTHWCQWVCLLPALKP